MARDNIVTVINRVEGPLQYTFNGDIKSLAPGENHIPAAEVEFAKTQNILMGSEDPLNPAIFTSLVGRKPVPNGKGKMVGDDCSAIVFEKDEKGQTVALFEDGTIIPVGIERIDRRQLGEALQGVVVKNKIPMRRGEVERSRFNDAAGSGALGG